MVLSLMTATEPVCVRLSPSPCIIPSSALPERLSLVLGAFDGMHRGHFALFRENIRLAKQAGAIPAVWSFPDPTCKHAPRLTSLPERLRLMALAGAEYAILTPFEGIRELSPAEFVSDILCGICRCAAAVCGSNFRFGKDRIGDADCLRALLAARGISLSVVPPVLDSAGMPISATAVRTALTEGDPLRAAALLGRWYSFSSPVIHGAELGRTIGVPTVNQLLPKGTLIPRHGVYAALCDIGDGSLYAGIANVGHKPTVAKNCELLVETHIFDYTGDLYGAEVRIAFTGYLRAEEKFSSLAVLRKQIATDIAKTKALLQGLPDYPV